MSRVKYKDELGEVSVGAIIQGGICTTDLLEVLRKEHLYDDVFKYECRLLHGSGRDVYTIMSYYNYKEVK